MKTPAPLASRRAVMGSALAIAGLAVPTIVASETAADQLHREVDAFEAWTARLNADSNAPASQWEEWSARHVGLLGDIEALPNVAENAQIKARAVGMIYDHQWADAVMDLDTTDNRLIVQVLQIVGTRA